MSDRLEQALQQELDELLRNHDPEQPVNVEGEFVLSDEDREAGMLLERLCAPPSTQPGPTRGIVTVRGRTWAVQFRKTFLGISVAILQLGGGILPTIAGIIQAIFFVSSCMHRLNKAEVYLISLLADTAEKKLDQKTLKSTYFKKGYAPRGDVELIFDRALDHLVELNIVTIQNPYVCLAHKVISLPQVKTIPRPSKTASSQAE